MPLKISNKLYSICTVYNTGSFSAHRRNNTVHEITMTISEWSRTCYMNTYYTYSAHNQIIMIYSIQYLRVFDKRRTTLLNIFGEDPADH